jgi:hypothetical protein
MTGTPKTLSSQIAEFCAEISPGEHPRYLEITPEPNSEQNDCFEIVRKKTLLDGGVILFGWSIWEWPSVYLEAEHHAVWQSAEGQPPVDLTPSANPSVTRRLFLPDQSAIYDYENEGIRRDNKRRALNSDRTILELFSMAEARSNFWNGIPGVGPVSLSFAQARKRQEIDGKMALLTQTLAYRYTGRNDPCFCQSGKKFKRCHGA